MDSARTIHIRARFGLALDVNAELDRGASLVREARHAAALLDERLGPGQIALITGPSGGGKSLIARQLALMTSPCLTPIDSFTNEHRAPIDLMVSPIEESAAFLASAGLADAHQLVTPAQSLSVGQQARLGLAIALERAALAQRPCTIIADEFASTLDRSTAASLGACLRKAVRKPIRFVAASAHDDLIEPLHPDLMLYAPLEGAPELHQRHDPCQRSNTRSRRAHSSDDSTRTMRTT